MRLLFFISVFSGLLLTGSSCRTSYRPQTVQYKDYRIVQGEQDSSMVAMISPYSDSVNKSMNGVVGIAEVTLEKKIGGGSLGLFMADALLYVARQKFNQHVDVAFMNYGGIRLTQLPAGPVTRGKIFELMPFDNILILQKMKGSQLQEFLDMVAARGGWPIAGMTMEIRNKKAMNVTIAGIPLDPAKMYTTANSDFVANGGDDASVLRSIPQENIGYLMRDAFFEYISWLKSQGKNITASPENRVIYVQ